MAIALNPTYPPPNRSRQRVQLFRNDDGVVDIGWSEGLMSDGRPFRAEFWARGETRLMTVFFPQAGLERMTHEDLRALMAAEGLAAFRDGPGVVCDAAPVRDDAGAAMWSVNIVIGDEAATYLDDMIPVWRHGGSGAPATLFGPRATPAGAPAPALLQAPLRTGGRVV